MNYEEKYKSALEWMRSIYPTMQGADKEDAEHYFPELRESEDERIRKEIISYIKSSGAVTNPNWIAWLEKQGEKKEIDYDEELKKCKDNPLYFYDKYVKIKLKEQGEQNSSWSEDDESMLTRCIGILGKCYMKELPNKVEEELIWLKSIKSKIQPNREWSIEDSERLTRIHQFIWANRKGDTDEIYQLEQDADWLKSLKPNHWKPSEEQMSMLLAVLNDSNNITAESVYIALKSLYNDLKKL